MLVVVKTKKSQIHSFDMPKVEKIDGQWKPVEVNGQPVTEVQHFYETGAVVNGHKVVARALAVNGKAALLYVKDPENVEAK